MLSKQSIRYMRLWRGRFRCLSDYVYAIVVSNRARQTAPFTLPRMEINASRWLPFAQVVSSSPCKHVQTKELLQSTSTCICRLVSIRSTCILITKCGPNKRAGRFVAFFGPYLTNFSFSHLQIHSLYRSFPIPLA